jgi:hypothetical protein
LRYHWPERRGWDGWQALLEGVELNRDVHFVRGWFKERLARQRGATQVLISHPAKEVVVVLWWPAVVLVREHVAVVMECGLLQHQQAPEEKADGTDGRESQAGGPSRERGATLARALGAQLWVHAAEVRHRQSNP